MPNPLPDEPFDGSCQNCGKTIAKGKNYYTVVVENKEIYICQECYDNFVQDGRVDPKTPSPYGIA